MTARYTQPSLQRSVRASRASRNLRLTSVRGNVSRSRGSSVLVTIETCLCGLFPESESDRLFAPVPPPQPRRHLIQQRLQVERLLQNLAVQLLQRRRLLA
jgi:hypothetical protein